MLVENFELISEKKWRNCFKMAIFWIGWANYTWMKPYFWSLSSEIWNSIWSKKNIYNCRLFKSTGWAKLSNNNPFLMPNYWKTNAGKRCGSRQVSSCGSSVLNGWRHETSSNSDVRMTSCTRSMGESVRVERAAKSEEERSCDVSGHFGGIRPCKE